MKMLTIMMLLAFTACGALADQTVSYGWEDGTFTVHGTYGNVGGTANVSDVVHTGNHALYAFEDPQSGTPQVFLALVYGLQDGDVVSADFWAFDPTPSGSPSARIWGHYTDGATDYVGSAGGNNDYSGAEEWANLSHTWTFDGAGDPERYGLMIEGRLYSGSGGNEFWFDDITVTAPDHAIVYFPNVVPVSEDATTMSQLKALFR